MAIADCDAAVGQEINIATGREISIGDLADELIRQVNPEARVVCEAERRAPAKARWNAFWATPPSCAPDGLAAGLHL